MKKERGITLVALVITIIILIILAGISINTLIGESGIITKAKQAKQNIILAGEAESLQLNQLYYELETGGELTENEESAKKDEIIENLQKELADISEKTNATADKILKDYVAYSKGELIRGLMEDNGELNGSLNCGESYIIPAGYTSGGTIVANSLESQTMATATADNLSEGVTAWVNGIKITGNGKDVDNSYESSKLYLYKAGDQYTTITGGWKSFVNYGSGGVAKFETNKIVLSGNADGNNQIAVSTNNKINVAGYNYFCVKTLTEKGFNMGSCSVNTGTNIVAGGYYYASVSEGNVDGIILRCPLKNDSYIVINVVGKTIEIGEVWLEK